MYTPGQAYELAILALCIWKDAHGGTMDEKHAAGLVARSGDYPSAKDPEFFDCLMAAKHVFDGTVK